MHGEQNEMGRLKAALIREYEDNPVSFVTCVLKATHFVLAVLFSSLECKWIPGKLQGNLTKIPRGFVRWTSIPSRPGGGGGGYSVPYISYIGTCGVKHYSSRYVFCK